MTKLQKQITLALIAGIGTTQFGVQAASQLFTEPGRFAYIDTYTSNELSYVALGETATIDANERSFGNQSVSGVAIGGNASVHGPKGIAIGDNVMAGLVGDASQDRNTIAIGTDTRAQADNSIALGATALAGTNPGQNSENSIAIGTSSSANGQSSIAFGASSKVTDNRGVAIGDSASVTGSYGTAIGARASAVGSAVAIGGGPASNNGRETSIASLQYSVALGGFARTTAAVDTSEATVTSANGTALRYGNFAGNGSDAPAGFVVSVGAKDRERQIQNVAAGQITETSTDAINGSQLYATNAMIGNVAGATANVIGANTQVNADGTFTVPATGIANTSKTNVHEAIIAARTTVASAGGTIQVTPTETDGAYSYNLDVNKGTITTGTDGKATAGAGNGATTNNSFATVEDVANAINNGGFTLKVSAGDGELVGTPADELIKAGSTVELVAGKNLTVSQEANGKVTFATKDDVAFNTVTATTSVGVTNGPSMTTGGINANNTKITNVADGTVSPDSKDAVNGSQLNEVRDIAFNVADSITNIIGTGTKNDGDGNFEGGDIANTGKGTIHEAIIAARTTVTSSDGSVQITPTETDGAYSYDLKVTLPETNVTKGSLTVNADGSVAAEAGSDTGATTENSFATVEDVKNAINNSGFTLKVSGDVANATGDELIKAGSTVDLGAGKNLTVTQEANGKVTFSTKDDVTFTSVTADTVGVTNGPSMTTDGINANNTKITNVADGTVSADSKDAVNGSQLFETANTLSESITNVDNRVTNVDNRVNNLDGRINNLDGRVSDLDSRVNKVGAGAAALAGLHPLDFNPDDKWNFAAAYGNYKNANALAVGAFYRPNEDTMFSVASSLGNGENMVNAGVSFKFGQNSGVTNSKVAMAKEIQDLKVQLMAQNEKINMLLNGFGGPNQNLDVNFPDVPRDHWAYGYVKTLADRGLLIGYPDGNFKGDRAMTRYEFAAVIYRALENGAPVDGNMAKALDEFGPELDQIQKISRFRVDRVAGEDNDRHKIERVRVNSKDDKENNEYRDVYGTHITK